MLGWRVRDRLQADSWGVLAGRQVAPRGAGARAEPPRQMGPSAVGLAGRRCRLAVVAESLLDPLQLKKRKVPPPGGRDRLCLATGSSSCRYRSRASAATLGSSATIRAAAVLTPTWRNHTSAARRNHTADAGENDSHRDPFADPG